jgi:unspecific monooxygenase
MALLTIAAGIVGSLVLMLYLYVRIPSSLPKEIPSVPIYVSLIGLWSDMGQDEIYDRWLRAKMEKYGAVKIWFAGRWNILATRPDIITHMFRNENIYSKAGSQKKIPWSVIAALVGDNIINSHGEVWKLYTGIMKPGMQKTNFDSKPILGMSRKFVDLLERTQNEDKGKGVLVNPLIQRFAIAAMGESFLDIDFKCLEQAGQRIEVLQSIIKRTIFKPLYFNFPALDKYPWLFRSRRTAFTIMQEFEDLLYDMVRNRPRKLERKEPVKPEDELVVHMLERALEDGRIDEEQFRDNLKIVFLTAHENTQQLLNSMFWQLGKDLVSVGVGP